MTLSIIIAGIVGTFAMTSFIELACIALRKPFHVVGILSYMLRFGNANLSDAQEKSIYAGALTLHYAIGVLFTWVFTSFIESNFLSLDWLHAILFGVLAGTIGITGWRTFFALHPKPPAINLFHYLTVIWAGHLVFSVVQFLVFSIAV